MSRQLIENKILESIPSKKMVRLHLSPRFGKTKLIISLIKRDNPEKILWVTPSKDLAKVDIPEEFKKWDAVGYIEKLKVITWASLKKETGQYDLIILDEEQYATDKNCNNFFNYSLKGKIVSMTGTPSTRTDKEEIYWKLGLKIAYTLTIDHAVSMNIVSDYEITIYLVDMSTESNIKAGSNNNEFMTSESSYYDYLDKKAVESYGTESRTGKIPWAITRRVEAIKKSPTKKELAHRLLDQICKGRTLIFAPFIDYAEELCLYSYHSKSENKIALEKFQNFEIDKLSLVNTGGVGFTFLGIEYLLIVQIDSNKTGISSQKIARSLLKQDNKDKVKILVLCLKDTKDEQWVLQGLKDFDKSKIKKVHATLK
jgi:superfamily II DNA or RNA helicase